MILLFSGTGNTLYVARFLSVALSDRNLHVFTPEELRNPAEARFECAENERVIWMFPTYSWGVPPVVAEVMNQAAFGPYMQAAKHYMVTTCGDDTGYIERQWRKIMNGRGLTAAQAYAVQMPNTYVFLPGFDVDKPDLANQKIEAAAETITCIAVAILSGDEHDYMIRRWPSRVKSRILYPLFVKMMMSPEPFHTTDGCTGCGACANSCPMKNITMAEGRPQWGDKCAFCLRCYHLCPRHAVAYGKDSNGKGQKKVLK